jgi:hypothetical protein
MSWMNKISKKTKNVINASKKFPIGQIRMDKDLKMGLFVFVILIIFGLLIRNLISEFVEKTLVFLLLYILVFLITHNVLISFVIGVVLYWIVNSMRNVMKKHEAFENQKKEGDDEKIDLKDLAKNEKTDKNIEETPVTEKETKDMDMNKASADIQKLVEKLQGGIALKEEDKKETPKLNKDFRNTKYTEEKNSPLKQAQIETYELMDTISNLENTIKTLSPVLNEGKKIMDMFESFQLDKN